MRPELKASARSGRIRVAFVLDELASARAGTEQQLLMLLNRLDRALVQPSVTVFRRSRLIDDWPIPDCPVDCLDIPRVKSPAALIKLLQFAGRLRREQVDIVHVLLNDAAVVMPIIARLGQTRVVASRRDLGFWHTPRVLGLMRLSNRFVDRIVVNSHAVLNVVADIEHYPREKIVLIRNGFDEQRLTTPLRDLRSELGISPTSRLVGIVANLNSWKRHGDLIEAVAQLVDRGLDVHAVLIGEGPERASLVSLAARLGLSARTHFLGSVEEPIPYIMALNVAVLCSQTEGASNALIEYLCCEVPVVLTDIAGNRELARHVENAYFYPPGDVEQLSLGISTQLDGARITAGSKPPSFPPVELGSRRMTGEYAVLYCHLARPTSSGPSVAETHEFS